MAFAGALANGETAVVGRPDQQDNDLLYSVNPDTGADSIVLEAPDQDVSRAITDPWLHVIIGASWGGDLYSESYVDPQLDNVYRKLASIVPGGSIHLRTWTADRSRIVVYLETTRDAGGFYLFDVARSQLSLIGMLHPEIKGIATIGDRRVITYPARDGTRIPAVLTLPASKPAAAGPLPLVVLSDGDARDRADLGYSWLASFLASRGYAVVEPNERGTYGYGDAWKVAGDGQWAHLMNNDIEDAATALAKAGLIDINNVCTVGVGDGGYSALLSATSPSIRYRCAVSVNGIADIPRFMTYLKLRTRTYSTFRRWYTRLLGTDKETNKAMKAISPAHRANAVQAAVLLIHDESDTISPLAQSDSMAAALEKSGKSVQQTTLRGEDHYLEEPETRIRILQEIETFLADHMKPLPAGPGG